MSERDRLVRYYQFYNPDKLGSVDEILRVYIGEEETLFDELRARYGAEPTDAQIAELLRDQREETSPDPDYWPSKPKPTPPDSRQSALYQRWVDQQAAVLADFNRLPRATPYEPEARGGSTDNEIRSPSPPSSHVKDAVIDEHGQLRKIKLHDHSRGRGPLCTSTDPHDYHHHLVWRVQGERFDAPSPSITRQRSTSREFSRSSKQMSRSPVRRQMLPAKGASSVVRVQGGSVATVVESDAQKRFDADVYRYSENVATRVCRQAQHDAEVAWGRHGAMMTDSYHQLVRGQSPRRSPERPAAETFSPLRLDHQKSWSEEHRSLVGADRDHYSEGRISQMDYSPFRKKMMEHESRRRVNQSGEEIETSAASHLGIRAQAAAEPRSGSIPMVNILHLSKASHTNFAPSAHAMSAASSRPLPVDGSFSPSPPRRIPIPTEPPGSCQSHDYMLLHDPNPSPTRAAADYSLMEGLKFKEDKIALHPGSIVKCKRCGILGISADGRTIAALPPSSAEADVSPKVETQEVVTSVESPSPKPDPTAEESTSATPEVSRIAPETPASQKMMRADREEKRENPEEEKGFVPLKIEPLKLSTDSLGKRKKTLYEESDEDTNTETRPKEVLQNTEVTAAAESPAAKPERKPDPPTEPKEPIETKKKEEPSQSNTTTHVQETPTPVNEPADRGDSAPSFSMASARRTKPFNKSVSFADSRSSLRQNRTEPVTKPENGKDDALTLC